MDTMICNECDSAAFDEGDDGFLYCQRCGVMANNMIQTVVDFDEFAWPVPMFLLSGRRRVRTIEMLPSVAILEKGGECAICLEEWRKDEIATELPCKHKYHLECVKKWLKIQATCPHCRYKMPLEAEEEVASDDDLGVDV